MLKVCVCKTRTSEALWETQVLSVLLMSTESRTTYRQSRMPCEVLMLRDVTTCCAEGKGRGLNSHHFPALWCFSKPVIRCRRPWSFPPPQAPYTRRPYGPARADLLWETLSVRHQSHPTLVYLVARPVPPSISFESIHPVRP